MVKLQRLISVAAIAVFTTSILHAKPAGDYQLGDTVEEDIVASALLTVVDPQATASLRQREARNVPVIIRQNLRAAGEAEAALRADFGGTQKEFLDIVEQSFKSRTLSAQVLASPVFPDLATAFLRQNRRFPATVNRLALWASGDPDRGYLDSLASTLRQTMARPVRPDDFSVEFRPGPTVCLIQTSDTNALTFAAAERLWKSTPATGLVSITAARRDLQNLFVSEERAVGRYLANFVKQNCSVE